MPTNDATASPPRLVPAALIDELHSLTAKVQSRTLYLSQCLAEGAGLGSKLGDGAFRDFCERELEPYVPRDGEHEWPEWRMTDTYTLPLGFDLNNPGGATENEALRLLDLQLQQLGLPGLSLDRWLLPIGDTESMLAQIEARAKSGFGYALTIVRMPAKLYTGVPQGYRGTVNIVVPSNSLRGVVRKTRSEFTRRLLELHRTLASIESQKPEPRLQGSPMSKLFMSHSSKDKAFAERLKTDLENNGHHVWLDKYAIKVGDSIPQKIAEGLSECEFVLVLLSKHSVDSKWVEEEWQAKYWDQLRDNKKYILPVLLDECRIPKFLDQRKYANFTISYDDGLAELVNSITPLENTGLPKPKLSHPKHVEALTALMVKVHAPDSAASHTDLT